MKQSATAGCISTLGARRSPVQTERGVTSFGNDVASSTVSSRRSNANGSAATYKPIIRNSASSFSLSRNSVRFVEQPPVCRVDTTGEPERTLSLSPTSTSSNSFSMQHPNTFERSFDQLANGACIDDCNLPQSAQSAQLASDEERKSNRSEWRNDRSRLRLDLPVQLSKMALSAINGSSHGVGVNGHGNDSFVLTQARLDYPACAHCGRAIDADDQTTNVNGSIWHTTCFTATNSEPLCEQCNEPVSDGGLDDRLVAYQSRCWHSRCFVCAQCFRPFKDGIFYEFDGRKYCEEDFNTLFAPCCKRCDAFITGRVIKAMNCNWHPACFCCEECSRCLAEEGFVKNAGRALCRDCNLSAKASSKVRHVCFRCHAEVEDSALLRFRNEVYHAYHFKCHSCSIECNADAREKEGEMFCLRCYDKMGVKICAACRRPIDERVVNAMGKSWHVEHFVCAKCEKPFLGSQHHEKKGQAYCTTHYLMLFGNVCFYCEQVISTEVVAALNKNWCPDHFSCSMCDRKLGPKSKFYDFDLKPVCKACYEKFPSELQKRLKKMSDKK